MDFKKELEKYGLKIYHKEHKADRDDPDDYEPIDFSIDDGADNVAWVWGSEPFSDFQVECNHPEECIEWGDDDERGECLLCGATCDWYWETDVVDEGHNEDGTYYATTGEVREITDWHNRDKFGGLIGKYIKHLQETW